MYSSKFKCRSESSTGTKGIHNTDLISVPLTEYEELVGKVGIYFCIRTYSSKIINPKIITDMTKSKVVFCRIANYIQEEDIVSIPNWMMESLEVEDDDIVTLSEVRIDKAKLVKIEPHNKEMFEVFTEDMSISEILSPLISNYGCLTKGSTITINLFGETWKINISDIISEKGKGKRGGTTMNTDIEVDILPALNDIPPKTLTNEEINEKVKKVLDELREEVESIQGFKPKDDVSLDEMTDSERARITRMKRFESDAKISDNEIDESTDEIGEEAEDHQGIEQKDEHTSGELTDAERARIARMKRFS